MIICKRRISNHCTIVIQERLLSTNYHWNQENKRKKKREGFLFKLKSTGKMDRDQPLHYNNSNSDPLDQDSNDNIDNFGNYPQNSKRQRFFNLMKNTKNVYLPKTMESLRNTTNSFNDYLETSASQKQYQQSQLKFPQDTKIDFYPTYTTQLPNGKFETIVRLSVVSPSDPLSRKNRWALMLCKQFLKPSTTNTDDDTLIANLEDSEDLINGNNDNNNDISSFSSTPSSTFNSTPVSQTTTNTSISTTSKSELDVVQDRISGFLSKKLSGISLIIDLFDSKTGESGHSTFETTDNMGFVLTKITTDFLPSSLQITLDTPPHITDIISGMYPINFIKPNGIGLISDIDDTIKHTGVTGDKRSMFRNVFVHDKETWLIDGIPIWYNTLKDVAKSDFFYVSNSPLQIYPILQDYISQNLPDGPLFLKQYSGNIVSSIMTSSANRKLSAISEVLQDFPEKKFFLVGDSGEHDLEAYITTAQQFPNQIMGIYIRCCKNSMSDFEGKEREVMDELNSIISKEFLTSTSLSQKLSKRRPPPPPLPKRKPILDEEHMNLISESKVSNISKEGTGEVSTSSQPPPLPSRQSTIPDINQFDGDTTFFDDTASLYYDKKAENWKNRISVGIQELKGTGNDKLGMRLMFFSDPSLPLEDSMCMVRNN
ncbi:hypothetical protein Kpol_1020p43 [Vanderwaltozyma polyspora DSM 70294]|uniref:Phosphatidate phosphatase APP1 catalytic domain-containing protein n=1 Tax=Vanderwaltozyma polyspora (strain ATCC 22028 / DSM 70294 / BCRC 21397 / CBS 2163 / NBRC 10782 / NRRL Y-8283 / UCD 57-17) TaxID=436907 RepID=A7TLF3_VANPO|nr:uncharacterized protein Kpol_1020p43 [Vanderwaltozyma polyspora DSM 70294]EDO16934.1 hypothetical protein Kpol_1020p43 [Vanderwaltozyma polyspora DSM 70294]